jgi:hypothetical protein
MKKGIFLFLFLYPLTIFSQPAKYSGAFSFISAGGAFAFEKQQSEIPHGYGFLINNTEPFFSFAEQFTFYLKEKWGLRISYTHINRNNQDAFLPYFSETFSSYETSGFGSIALAGSRYSYGVAALCYKFQARRFVVSGFAGLGLGKYYPPHFGIDIKKKGSNDFKEIHYDAKMTTFLSVNAGVDAYYQFPKKGHGLNWILGITMEYTTASQKNTVTYSDQNYGQSQPYTETFTARDKLNNMSIRAFIGLAFPDFNTSGN